MNKHQIISWIYLAIAYGSQKEPINMRGISDVADGINHAVPNQDELQLATKWLIKNDLVEKIGKKYKLTNSGFELHKSVPKGKKSILDTWHFLEDKIKKIETT